MTKLRRNTVIVATAVSIVVLWVLSLTFGSVNIPLGDVLAIMCGRDTDNLIWRYIVVESRLPVSLTAILSGAALSVAGLLMQTLFNNPLAGPSILGVSTGSSLGVAIVMLACGGSLVTSTASTVAATVIAAILGAAFIMVVLLAFSAKVKSTTMLLIVGIMVNYLASSAISLLNFFSTQEGVHSYVIWGLGNFSGVPLGSMPVYALLICIALVASLLMIKPLNALLLGRNYAENLGINIMRVRSQLLLVSGILTAVVTAYCGPIGFIGLVVPHIARLLLGSSNHGPLLTVTLLMGAAIGLLTVDISAFAASSVGVLPINAITPIIGVPIILYIIINRRKIFYFS